MTDPAAPGAGSNGAGSNGAGRTDAPSSPRPPVDRKAAFAAGVPKMPRRIIYVAVAVVLVLGLGGSLADRFVGSSTSSSTSKVKTSSPIATHSLPAGAKRLTASMPAFLGLAKLKSHPAPPLSLTDARTGHSVSLADLHGHVVVLTFANAACNDICPVLASELRQADGLIGRPAVPVTFVTVNTDPLVAKTSHPAILSQATLSALPNWRFLTGTVSQLNSVWKHYGISITVDSTTRMASHNELLYMIAPDGNFAWRAIPFANESTSGKYSLPAAQTARFARGIARLANNTAGAP